MENNYITDKEIKRKVEDVGPLEGGIVFGKEEVWEKLQRRMDDQPKRKIPLGYWLVAAAILLAVLCISVLYPKNETIDLAKSNHPAIKQNNAIPTTNIAVPATAPMNQGHENTLLPAPATTHMPHPAFHGYVVPGKPGAGSGAGVTYQEEKIILNDQSLVGEAIDSFDAERDGPLPEVIHKSLDGVATKEQPQGIKNLAKMKVVHINEINKDGYLHDETTSNTVDYSNTAFMLAHMPVVHINDVIKQQNEGYLQLEGNKTPLNLFTFMKPHQNDFSVFGEPISRTTLKIKLKSN